MSNETQTKSTKLEQRGVELFKYIDQFLYNVIVTDSNNLDTPWGTLNHQEDKVIKVLGTQGPCIMREIAEPLGLALSTATGVVDRLNKKNLVYRERSEKDRRIVKVGLTDKGKEINESNKTGIKKLCRRMLAELTEEEQTTYISLSKKISQINLSKP